MKRFVHLHVHSNLSLLDSTIKVSELIERVVAWGMPAVALTDHMNIFASVSFVKLCEKSKIKPIIGAELVVDGYGGRNYHLVVLCRNQEGFANLRRILTHSYLEGMNEGVPKIKKDFLKEHTKGLIGLSGCLGGEIPQAILRGDYKEAEETAIFYRETFGERSFYLELQGNRLKEQEIANKGLIELSQSLDIPIVATNNAHYLDPDDAIAQAVLVCIEMKRTLDKTQRESLPLRSFHLASPEEMWERFGDYPQALENTCVIADSIEPDAFILSKKLHFPIFSTPDGSPTSVFLERIAKEGLEKRIEKMRQMGEEPDYEEYQRRLMYEIRTITALGFDAYYLIVWDFIRWAKEHDIPVGPGRGSGAGSLVAYAIGITDIDPIRYNLLFERFLNPERVSPPDFDVDFCPENRERVIQYVTEKYGRDKVGQIITYGSLKAKAVIRDVARVMGWSYGDGDRLAKMIPKGQDVTLQSAYEQVSTIRELVETDEQVKELWEIAKKLEGLNRQPGKHAAGVVIADKPIMEYAPLYVTGDGSIVTQFNMKDLEEVGLLKFDFLGLDALTVIANTVKIIRSKHDPNFVLEEIPLNDKATFELISSGATAGVFQLESRGITDLVKRMRPDCIEDLIAIIALFRPGPLGSGMVDSYIRRKHGEEKVVYPHPLLEPILRDTYGVIVYQEQVMLIASTLSGFSLGQADLLRRAMGKKKMDELMKMRVPFVEGAVQRGVSREKAEEIFELMIPFAEYGFNKSHSAAYAIVSYRMAYLKTHFPTEFMCARLTSDRGKQEKVMRCMREARALGIPLLPPDVNRSQSDFTVEEMPDKTKKMGIRFGLSAVKGIGNASVDAILQARKEGPFETILDFLSRIDSRKVNKKVLEALVKGGALDSFGYNRATLFEGIEILMEAAQSRKNQEFSGQIGLFDSIAHHQRRPSEVPIIPEWSLRKKLSYEKEALGYFVSGHPMEPYEKELTRYSVTPIADLEELEDGRSIVVAGIVVSATEKITKGGQSRMAFITVEDTSGQVECIVFPSAYPKWAELSGTEEPLLVKGVLQFETEGETESVKIRVDTIEKLDIARQTLAKGFEIILDLSDVKEQTIEYLSQCLKRHKGKCPVFFRIIMKGVGELVLKAGPSWTVNPCESLFSEIEKSIGQGTVTTL